MRNRFIFALAAAAVAALLILAFGNREKMSLHGNLIGLPDNSVYLHSYSGSLTLVDSTRSEAGSFRFELPDDMLADIYFVNFEGYPDYFIPVILGEGDVFIEGNLNYHDQIKVYGTESNDALWNFREQIRDYEIMIKAIELELSDLVSSPQDEVDERIEFLQDKKENIQALINQKRQEFITMNPGSIVSAMFTAMAITDACSQEDIRRGCSRASIRPWKITLLSARYARGCRRQSEACIIIRCYDNTFSSLYSGKTIGHAIISHSLCPARFPISPCRYDSFNQKPGNKSSG